jgi:hypothetical protein
MPGINANKYRMKWRRLILRLKNNDPGTNALALYKAAASGK